MVEVLIEKGTSVEATFFAIFSAWATRKKNREHTMRQELQELQDAKV